ncbi:hypothetical protein PRIPAC_92956 [Pristionchus pacificus]|uniref:Uncharacterized protein n=1 Tax=Pristionchus pacificus TaxID=54126 RepID=A0A2A6CH86_PRIPA|nr:hypothetical protein PRIPAC_92956 [Pristionchus pacificus]|eukprot:PDM77499.1 hypothetical protein PRIPAC_34366 [Pristionchus pacificus]
MPRDWSPPSPDLTLPRHAYRKTPTTNAPIETTTVNEKAASKYWSTVTPPTTKKWTKFRPSLPVSLVAKWLAMDEDEFVE